MLILLFALTAGLSSPTAHAQPMDCPVRVTSALQTREFIDELARQGFRVTDQADAALIEEIADFDVSGSRNDIGMVVDRVYDGFRITYGSQLEQTVEVQASARVRLLFVRLRSSDRAFELALSRAKKKLFLQLRALTAEICSPL